MRREMRREGFGVLIWHVSRLWRDSCCFVMRCSIFFLMDG